MKKYIAFLCTACFAVAPAVVSAQIYKDAGAPVEARVSDLLGRMSTEEKKETNKSDERKAQSGRIRQ